MPEDFILELFDTWMATNYNTTAVFGCSFIELPLYVRADLRTLMVRKARLEAMKPKR